MVTQKHHYTDSYNAPKLLTALLIGVLALAVLPLASADLTTLNQPNNTGNNVAMDTVCELAGYGPGIADWQWKQGQSTFSLENSNSQYNTSLTPQNDQGNLTWNASPSPEVVLVRMSNPGGGTGTYYAHNPETNTTGNFSSSDYAWINNGGQTPSANPVQKMSRVVFCGASQENNQPIQPVCTLDNNEYDYIVEFNERLRADYSAEDAFTENKSLSLSTGHYSVTLVSYDGYDGRESATQPNEQWFLNFYNEDGDLVKSSNSSEDLPDGVNYTQQTDLVNEFLYLSENTTTVGGQHYMFPPSQSNNPDSLDAVCAGINELPTCVQARKDGDVTHTWNATAGTATVTNNGQAPYTFSLATYQKFDLNDSNIPYNQTLYDNQTAVIYPGENHTFSVTNPSCAYQIDLVCGDVIESFEEEGLYSERLLAYSHPNDDAGVCEEDTNTNANVHITKYTCDQGTQVDSANDISTDGSHEAPETCSRQEGVQFGYVEQTDKEIGDTGSPWDRTPIAYTGVTNESGELVFSNLNTTHRYGIVELDGEGNPIEDLSNLLFFSCTDDAGNNYVEHEYVFPENDTTKYCVAYNKRVSAEVLMCKQDHVGNSLEDWQLMLLGEEPVATVEVFPDGEVYSSSSLPDGDYVVIAEGAYVYRPTSGATHSDAAFSQRDPSDNMYQVVGPTYDTWVRLYNHTDHLTLQVNGAPVDWGEQFSHSHTYAYATSHEGAFDFQITDTQYNDNSGSIQVAIYEGYAGWTGEDGCFAIDVPHGEYVVNETNHLGWEVISGLGNITVEGDTNITVVNENPQPQQLTCIEALKDGQISSSWDAEAGIATVTNNGAVAYTFSLATYQKHDLGADIPNNQTLYDNETVTIQPGANYTFSVTNPSCAYQIDLVCGEPIKELSTENMYGERKLAYAHPNDESGACVEQEATLGSLDVCKAIKVDGDYVSDWNELEDSFFEMNISVGDSNYTWNASTTNGMSRVEGQENGDAVYAYCVAVAEDVVIDGQVSVSYGQEQIFSEAPWGEPLYNEEFSNMALNGAYVYGTTNASGSFYLTENYPNAKLLIVNSFETPVCFAEDERYASEVVSVEQGATKGGSDVLSVRSNESAALNFTAGQDESNFFSLGFGGEIIVSFAQPFSDGPGDDLVIYEDTWSNSYPEESADVFVSQDGSYWEFIGTADNNDLSGNHASTAFDLSATNFSWAQYVKVVDTTNASLHNNAADGFDLNGIEALYVHTCKEDLPNGGDGTGDGDETSGSGNETSEDSDSVTSDGPQTFGARGGDGGLNSWLDRFQQEPVLAGEPETGSGSSPGVTVEPVDEPEPQQPPATEQPPAAEDNGGNLLTGAVVGGGAGAGLLWALIIAVLVGGGVWYATRP